MARLHGQSIYTTYMLIPAPNQLCGKTCSPLFPNSHGVNELYRKIISKGFTISRLTDTFTESVKMGASSEVKIPSGNVDETLAQTADWAKTGFAKLHELHDQIDKSANRQAQQWSQANPPIDKDSAPGKRSLASFPSPMSQKRGQAQQRSKPILLCYGSGLHKSQACSWILSNAPLVHFLYRSSFSYLTFSFTRPPRERYRKWYTTHSSHYSPSSPLTHWDLRCPNTRTAGSASLPTMAVDRHGTRRSLQAGRPRE
ncbi:MAG: hypothetical protein Q9167_005744 [Letrouitia subvulpina]